MNSKGTVSTLRTSLEILGTPKDGLCYLYPLHSCMHEYTLFQNGCHFSIYLFDFKLALLASFNVNYSFEFYV